MRRLRTVLFLSPPIRAWMLLLAGAVLGLPAGRSRGDGRTGPHAFAADPRFEVSITVAAPGLYLDEFLADLRERYQLPVRAGTSTRDDRVIVFARERQAGELLAEIAAHLEFTWQAGSGSPPREYTLIQTPAQKRREADALAAQRAARLDRLVEAVERLRDEDRLGPFRATEARIARLRARQREAGERAGRLLAPETAALEQALSRLATAARPRPYYPASRLLRSEDLAVLAAGRSLEFRFPAQAGYRGLSHAAAAELAQAALDSSRLWIPRGAGESTRPQVQDVERLRVTFLLQVEEAWLPGLEVNGKFLVRGSNFRVESRFSDNLVLDQEDAEEDLRDPLVDPDDRELDREVELRLPRRFAGPESRLLPASLPMLLELVADAAPWTIISDDYDGLQSDHLFRRLVKERLGVFLHRCCRRRNLRARRQGGTLFVRAREWAWLRAQQLPRAPLQRWEAVIAAKGGLSLRTQCEIARLRPALLRILNGRWIDDWRGIEGSQERMVGPALTEQVGIRRMLSRFSEAVWRRLERGEAVEVVVPHTRETESLFEAWAGNVYPYDRKQIEGEEVPEGNSVTAPLGAGFELDDALARVTRAPLRVRLEIEPTVVRLGKVTMVEPGEDADLALHAERKKYPNATLDDFKPVRCNRVRIHVRWLHPGIPGEEDESWNVDFWDVR
jgi:hypothetical protein